jgi:hypothetical protein
VNRAEQETRPIYYKDVYIVGFESSIDVENILNYNGETTTITPQDPNANTYGVAGNINPINILYKIYYNDGTVKENNGVDI